MTAWASGSRLATCGLLSLVVACGSAHGQQPVRAQPPPGEAWLSPSQLESSQITVASADERDVAAEITTTGRIAFDDLRVAHVVAPVAGRVVRILAEPGARVRAGAPLAVLDAPDLGGAIADVRKAEADLTAAKHELRRQRELVEAQAAARRDLEQAEDNERKAQAEVDRARARVRLLHGDGATQGEQLTLRSPVAGEVIARNVNPGADVQGQYAGGTPQELFTVGSLDRVWLTADVYELDLGRVHPGAALSITVPAFPHRVWEARVEWVSGALDPQTRTARLRATIENGDHSLRPEMYAQVKVQTDQKRALAVPRSAVVRAGEELVTFVQVGHTENGLARFARRPVRIDEDATGELVPVLAGLNRGEQVVVAGGIQLLGLL